MALPCAVFPMLVGSALPSAAAAALIPAGPATVLTHGPTPESMPGDLSGAVCQAPKVCKEVDYDWIQPMGLYEPGVNENVWRLNAAINKTTGPTIVYAFSGGARIASVWLSRYADSKNAPSADDLSFVLIGNGGRKYGGVNGWFYKDLLATPTDTQYDIIDVAREYDPIADFPVNPFNALALANAAAAFFYVHLRYDQVDLDDPDNIVWKEGNTTYVYVPTAQLPLVQALDDLGMGSLVAGMEPTLRAIIDKAYSRPWLDGKLPQGEQDLATATSTSVAQTGEQVKAAPTTLSAVVRAALTRAGVTAPASSAGGAKTPATAAPTDTATESAPTPTPQASETAGTPETAKTPDTAKTPETPKTSETTGETADTPATAPKSTDDTTDAETAGPDDATGATTAGAASTSGTGKHRAPLFGTKKKSSAAAEDASAGSSSNAASSNTPSSSTASSATASSSTSSSESSSGASGTSASSASKSSTSTKRSTADRSAGGAESD
jgi:diacyltrehalose acyltransferase